MTLKLTPINNHTQVELSIGNNKIAVLKTTGFENLESVISSIYYSLIPYRFTQVDNTAYLRFFDGYLICLITFKLRTSLTVIENASFSQVWHNHSVCDWQHETVTRDSVQSVPSFPLCTGEIKIYIPSSIIPSTN